MIKHQISITYVNNVNSFFFKTTTCFKISKIKHLHFKFNYSRVYLVHKEQLIDKQNDNRNKKELLTIKLSA